MDGPFREGLWKSVSLGSLSVAILSFGIYYGVDGMRNVREKEFGLNNDRNLRFVIKFNFV